MSKKSKHFLGEMILPVFWLLVVLSLDKSPGIKTNDLPIEKKALNFYNGSTSPGIIHFDKVQVEPAILWFGIR